jgi:hypothetical protein
MIASLAALCVAYACNGHAGFERLVTAADVHHIANEVPRRRRWTADGVRRSRRLRGRSAES